MSTEFKKVLRDEHINRADLENALLTRQLGVANEGNDKLIGYKDSNGSMSYYIPEGGNASYNSLAITGLTQSGYLFADASGNVSIAEGVGSGDPQSSKWVFNTATNGVIGNGDWALNNVNPSSATELYLSSVDRDGTDYSSVISLLYDNSAIIFQDDTDATKFNVCYVGNVPVLNAGIYTIPVVVDRVGATAFENLDVTQTLFIVEAGGSIGEVDFIDFIPQSPLPEYKEGRFHYDDNEKTMRVYNDNPDFGVSIGQTSFARGKNETGATITKGTAVEIRNISSTLDGVQIHVADAYKNANKSDEGWVFGVATEDILDGDYGSVAFYGAISGVDTSGLIAGEPAYLGANGTIVAERPDYPAESVLMGTAIVVDPVNGVFQTFVERDNYDYEFDGTILERQETNIVVDGTSVFLEVSNLADPTRDLPIQIGGKILQLDTTTGAGTGGTARVELVQGTPTQPQEQLVYVYDNGGIATLAVSTGYPAPPFAIMSEISIRDYTTVSTEGPDMDRRITSAKAHDSRGRISYLTERFAIESPKWWKGCTPTATINTGPTPDVLDLSVIAGIVYQTHRQDFPALSVVTDGIYVANGSGGAGLANYSKYNNLTEVCGYVNADVPRDNSARGHLVVFGVVNKDTSECKLFVNLPTDLYGGGFGGAYFDPDSTAVYTVPDELRFTAFLIAQIPYDLGGGGNTISFINPTGREQIINLLGTPIGVSGGASGGTGTFIPNLSQVLAEGNDAGNVQIKNMANGTDPQDAVTKSQSEAYSDGKMEWKNVWVAGTYDENDVVRDGDWTMVANKQTSDRPAPQPVGEVEDSFPVDPVFVELSDSSVVYSGHKYTFTKSGWLTELKVYVSELTENTNYRIIIENESTGGQTVINDPILTEDGFATVALGASIVTSGTVLNVYIDALNSGADTPLNGGWTAQGNTNDTPNTSSWTSNSFFQTAITRLRFDKTDLDSDDRSTELLNAIEGTSMLLNDGSNNFTFVTNAAPVDGGSYVEYTGSVSSSNGTVTGTTTVNMTIPVAQPTKYAEQTNYWAINGNPTFATVEGILEYNGVPQAATNNAYGIDLLFQDASVSEDWDLLAFSGGGSGGSGGGSGDSLWTESGGVLFPTSDPDKIKLGVGSGQYTGKLEVMTDGGTVPTNAIEVTGSNVSDVNGVYTYVNATTYQKNATRFIKDTGYYWNICSDNPNVWDGTFHYGAGGLNTPSDSDEYFNYNGATGSVFASEASGGIVNQKGVTTNSTIHAEGAIISDKALQLNAEGNLVLGQSVNGDWGVGVINNSTSDNLFIVNEAGSDVPSFVVKDNGRLDAPLCTPSEVESGFSYTVATKGYVDNQISSQDLDAVLANGNDANNQSIVNLTSIGSVDFSLNSSVGIEMSFGGQGNSSFTINDNNTPLFNLPNFNGGQFVENGCIHLPEASITNIENSVSDNVVVTRGYSDDKYGAKGLDNRVQTSDGNGGLKDSGVWLNESSMVSETTSDFRILVPQTETIWFGYSRPSGGSTSNCGVNPINGVIFSAALNTEIDDFGGGALITKDYADANYSGGGSSKKSYTLTFIEEGAISNNTALPLNGSGNPVTLGFTMPVNGTVKSISWVNTSYSAGSNTTAEVNIESFADGQQYVVGNGTLRASYTGNYPASGGAFNKTFFTTNPSNVSSIPAGSYVCCYVTHSGVVGLTNMAVSVLIEEN